MDFGNITLDQLSKIIARNNFYADKHGIAISWVFTKPGFIFASMKSISPEGRVREKQDFVIDKDLHFVIAEIQYWFWQELKSVDELFNCEDTPIDNRELKWKKGEGFKPID